jgi:hypothetical protein
MPRKSIKMGSNQGSRSYISSSHIAGPGGGGGMHSLPAPPASEEEVRKCALQELKSKKEAKPKAKKKPKGEK